MLLKATPIKYIRKIEHMMTIPQTSGKELLNTTDYKSLKPNLSRSKISEIGSLKVVTVAVWNKMH